MTELVMNNGWQSIETAPLDGRDLLLCYFSDWVGDWVMEVGAAGNVDVARQGCGSLHGRATHWMPLPKPPNNGGI